MVRGDRGSGNQIGGSEPEVLVIGAGLAGTEAAWQVAQAGVRVRLVEMRPVADDERRHYGR
jgi:folate-dependent tRNA-U54 methylase TrmFO/GidA